MTNKTITPIISMTISISQDSNLKAKTANVEVVVKSVGGVILLDDAIDTAVDAIRSYIKPISSAPQLPLSAIKPAFDKIRESLQGDGADDMIKTLHSPLKINCSVVDTHQKEFYFEVCLTQELGTSIEVVNETENQDVWGGHAI